MIQEDELLKNCNYIFIWIGEELPIQCDDNHVHCINKLERSIKALTADGYRVNLFVYYTYDKVKDAIIAELRERISDLFFIPIQSYLYDKINDPYIPEYIKKLAKFILNGMKGDRINHIPYSMISDIIRLMAVYDVNYKQNNMVIRDISVIEQEINDVKEKAKITPPKMVELPFPNKFTVYLDSDDYFDYKSTARIPKNIVGYEVLTNSQNLNDLYEQLESTEIIDQSIYKILNAGFILYGKYTTDRNNTITQIINQNNNVILYSEYGIIAEYFKNGNILLYLLYKISESVRNLSSHFDEWDKKIESAKVNLDRAKPGDKPSYEKEIKDITLGIVVKTTGPTAIVKYLGHYCGAINDCVQQMSLGSEYKPGESEKIIKYYHNIKQTWSVTFDKPEYKRYCLLVI